MTRRQLSFFLLLALCSSLFAAGSFKIKKIKPSANPPQYAAFSKPLSKQAQLRHALERLTFGPRPGELEQLQKQGLAKWIDAQLHPERLPEDRGLATRLAPLESLHMSIHDAYVHYPSPRMIAAFARGRDPLPEDPELRAIVVRLVDRYLERKQLQDASIGQEIKDPNDDSDLEPKFKLRDLLSPEQIETLRSGKPDEKKRVLEAIPPAKRLDFIYALHRPERQQLFAVAPTSLRRDLMLAVNPQLVVASDLSEGKLLRAIYSTHQLQELLVDFWYNHFNVFLFKGADRYLVPSYEREGIRPGVFGKFSNLLLATAKSPAMLFYLDNWQSVGPDFDARRTPDQKKRGLNENYGRELLELHTLGVDGGYSQKDVVEVARCFTGWTIAHPRKGGEFEYNDRVHDKGQKVVLGHIIPAGGGMNDGLKVLDIIAHHPSTAHFISLKLARRFVADDPPPSLVNRMAQTFSKTDGDLRRVMETLVTSSEFWSQGAYSAKVKTPFEMVVSALRATDADVSSATVLVNQLQRLGQPLYRKIEPTGYSSANSEWISSAGLLDRMNFALALTHNRVPGVTVNVAQWQTLIGSDPLQLARSILEADPSVSTRTAIEKTLKSPDLQRWVAQNAKAGSPQTPSLIAGLTIGSPEFQHR
jgi:uncharacterized protein (DUF1800 family)